MFYWNTVSQKSQHFHPRLWTYIYITGCCWSSLIFLHFSSIPFVILFFAAAATQFPLRDQWSSPHRVIMHKSPMLFLLLFHTQIAFIHQFYIFDCQFLSVCVRVCVSIYACVCVCLCVCMCVWGSLLGRALACLFSSAPDLLWTVGFLFSSKWAF